MPTLYRSELAMFEVSFGVALDQIDVVLQQQALRLVNRRLRLVLVGAVAKKEELLHQPRDTRVRTLPFE